MQEPARNCRRCARLAALRRDVRTAHPDYHAAPVPAFGPRDAALLVVGLAPGMHGANATGRPFTGDHAGLLLYQTLFDFGFASAPESRAVGDGLTLHDCRVTNAVKCLPPDNKPVAAEVNACNRFLAGELAAPQVLVLLGGLAHKAVIRALGLRQSDFLFGHDVQHRLADGRVLIDSYHCSRYNTNTGRLTAPMFADVFRRARGLLQMPSGLSGSRMDAS